MATEEISPDFPFEKKRVNTLDSFMAYVDTGHPSTAATTTVVFVHGNPTSSYLWRNVIPHVSPGARCVAPDLVGFGDSGKMPSGGYYIKEHIEYFAAFMEAVVPANEKGGFVIHDWGSGLGFDWARKNEERMAGLVCMELIHMMVTTEDFVGWERNLNKMRDPETGHKCVIEENYFVEVILREEGTSKGPLPDAIMEHYRRPFAHPADREPQWRMPNEIPLEGRAPEVGEILYKAWNW